MLHVLRGAAPHIRRTESDGLYMGFTEMNTRVCCVVAFIVVIAAGKSSGLLK